MIQQTFDDGFHLLALGDRREGDSVTKTLVQDANGGIGVKVTRTEFGLRPINFINVITMLSVIRDENEVDGDAFFTEYRSNIALRIKFGLTALE